MINLLRGVLICSPFFQYLFIGKPIRTSQALLSILSEILMILVFLNFIKRKPDLRGLSCFWGYITLHTGFIIGNSLLFKGGLNQILLPYVHISLFFLYYVILSMVVDKEIYEKIMRVLPYIATGIALFCIYQKFEINQFKYNQTWINGVLGNPTDNAMYLTVCLPFFFMLKRPHIPLIIILIGLLALESFSLVVALIILYVILVKEKRWKALICYSVSFGSCILFFQNKLGYFLNPYEKLQVWNIALEQWRHSCLVGYGLNNWAFRGIVIKNSYWAEIHNDPLFILHSFGIVGLLFLIIFLYPILKTKYSYALLSVISVLLLGLFSIPMYIYSIVLIMGINLAYLTGERNGNKIPL